MIEVALTILAGGFLICCALLLLGLVFSAGLWLFLLLSWPIVTLLEYLERHRSKLPLWLQRLLEPKWPD